MSLLQISSQLPRMISMRLLIRRNIATGGMVMAASKNNKQTSTIRQMFLDKVKEYQQKKKTAGGSLVDASAEEEKAMKDELNRINMRYGGGNLTEFPKFDFEKK